VVIRAAAIRAAAAVAALLIVAGCSEDRDTRRFRVPSSSMEPTLHCARPALGCEAPDSDRLAVRPYGDDDPERGDIVVFETPPKARDVCGAAGKYVKRVVALPGERWSEKAGVIYVDGVAAGEPYIHPDRRDDRTLAGGVIPAGQYLLLGDNRAHSCDSRFFGLVPRQDLVGKVVEIARGSDRIHIR
jgi:signal peptidase I